MTRIATLFFLTLLSSWILSCTSTPKSQLPSFESALQKAVNGNLDKAQQELNSLCQQGATAGCALLGQKAQTTHPLSILQGLTSKDTSLFSVVAPKEGSLLFIYSQADGTPLQSIRRFTLRTEQRDHSSWKVDHLAATKLDPQKHYLMFVIGPDGTLWDQREFQSVNTDKNRTSFIVASCMDDGFDQEQKKIWPEVMSWDSDYVLLIGDNVYADKYMDVRGDLTPEQLWQRYVETRNKLTFYKSRQLRPTLATWDDHDYGSNNGGADYKYKAESADIFQAFFAQESEMPIYQRGPGVSSYLKAFNQNFLFLDDRSFLKKDENKAGNYGFWGETQEDWAFDILKQNPQPTWLINGSQYFGAYSGFESFEGSHPKNFKQVLSKLKQAKAPVVFISGDRHLAEMMRISKQDIGYVTYELTSSGVHAKTYPESSKIKNPRRMEISAGPLNYMLIESEVDGPTLKANVTSYTLDKKVLFQRQISVQN